MREFDDFEIVCFIFVRSFGGLVLEFGRYELGCCFGVGLVGSLVKVLYFFFRGSFNCEWK